MTRLSAPPQADSLRLLEHSLACVRSALSDLKFGSVSLTVHEGRVVQIDVTEKTRITPEQASNSLDPPHAGSTG